MVTPLTFIMGEIIMERKTKEINLFGEKLLLSERYVIDIMTTVETFKNKGGMDKKDILLLYAIAATVLQDGLKINYENAKWYNFHKKTLSKKLTSKKLLENLTQLELGQLSGYVYELEGLTVQKVDGEDEAEKKSIPV